jgi:type VI secretion system protein ImpG
LSDSLLPYFNRELLAVRRLAAEFAQTHPKIAGRLRLSPDAVDDPHVARLLDGVAFLSARVQRRLDDEFPELTDALLGVLYPHYLAPFPSCAIAQFAAKPDVQKILAVPAGFALETERVRGQACQFRTAYDLNLWPIRIESVKLSGQPFVAPPNKLAAGAAACLRIVLSSLNPAVNMSMLGIDQLRIFLRGGSTVAQPLFELLAAHVNSVALADSPGDAHPVILPASAISPVGFAANEALLPWPARSFTGFRLLSEYFAFPDKFMFLDIAGLDQKSLVSSQNRMEIFVYLNRSKAELERAVGAEHIAIGCTPIVNLFEQQCEPVKINHSDIEYRVVPDARRSGGMEVWALNDVRAVKQDGSSRPWRPFYRLTHGDQSAEAASGFYQEIRRDAPGALGGSETYLAPFEPGFDPTQKSDDVLSVNATCLNRDLPADLPFGGGHPVINTVTPHDAVASITCLTPPTATLRASLRERGAWRLISHLSLGHLSVVGGASGAAALKEVLRLYDRADTAETRAAIESILAVSSRPGTARVPGSRLGSFCRGLDVSIEFDPRAYQDAGLYVLGSVLDRFLALHATVNSFVRTTVRLRGRIDPAAKFPPRAGARSLL